jgi:hypothetical protein
VFDGGGLSFLSQLMKEIDKKQIAAKRISLFIVLNLISK